LFLDPRVQFCQPHTQRLAGLPFQHFLYQLVVRVAAAHAERARDVLDGEAFPGDLHDQFGQLVDGYHLFRADVDRTGEGRARQTEGAFQAFVDIEKRACLLAIAPELDRAAAPGFRHLAAHSCRRLLLAARPGALWTEDIVISSDPRLHREITVVGQV